MTPRTFSRFAMALVLSSALGALWAKEVRAEPGASGGAPDGEELTRVASLDIRPGDRSDARRSESRDRSTRRAGDRRAGSRDARRDRRSGGDRTRARAGSRPRSGDGVVRRDHRRDRDARGSRSRYRASWRGGGRVVVTRDHRYRYVPSRVRLRRAGVAVGGGVFYESGYASRSCCYDDYRDPAPRPLPAEAPKPLPAFGFGAFAGGAGFGEDREAAELGLLARYRLTESLKLEGELSSGHTETGDRIDRHIGAALLFDTLPRSTLSPYFLAGMGATHAQAHGGAEEAGFAYGEVGAGLTYRFTDSLSVIADLRVGLRRTAEEALKASSSFAPEEDFARARLGGLYYF